MATVVTAITNDIFNIANMSNSPLQSADTMVSP